MTETPTEKTPEEAFQEAYNKLTTEQKAAYTKAQKAMDDSRVELLSCETCQVTNLCERMKKELEIPELHPRLACFLTVLNANYQRLMQTVMMLEATTRESFGAVLQKMDADNKAIVAGIGMRIGQIEEELDVLRGNPAPGAWGS